MSHMSGGERAGLLAAIAGFALFSVGDAIAKSVTGEWSPVALAAARFTFGALFLGTLLAVREGRAAFIPANPWLQLLRGFALAVGTICFFSAVFLMPLSSAISIAFAAPAITALLSGPVLGEKVSRLTWIAIATAFTGVLVALQPGLTSLGWPALLPLGTAFGMSTLVMCNRASAGKGSVLSMQFSMTAGAALLLVPASIIAGEAGIPMLALDWPNWTVFGRCAAITVTGTLGHALIYFGTTRAGAAHVAPATYIQLITAALLGWTFFGNVPELVTVAGALIIVTAGLILWWDGRILASARQR